MSEIKLHEIPKLLVIGIANNVVNMAMSVRSWPSYIRSPKQLSIDLTLLNYYQFHYPISKQKTEKKATKLSESDLIEGKTPYFTFDKILKKISPKPNSIFVDIGCGHGHLVFYANQAYRLRSIGLEVISSYVRVAQNLTTRHKLKGLKFIQKPFWDVNLGQADIVYSASTTFTKESQKKLFEMAENLKPGAIVVTLSYPIESKHYKIKSRFTGRFSWGKAQIFIQERTHAKAAEDSKPSNH